MTSKNLTVLLDANADERTAFNPLSYLSLLYDEQTATTVDKLKRTSISEYKAKDIFRASGLSLLRISNFHVKKDQQKPYSTINESTTLTVMFKQVVYVRYLHLRTVRLCYF